MPKFEMKLLNEVCDINIGKTPARANAQYWNGNYKWLAIGDMKNKYIVDTNERITEKAIKECNMKLIPKDTVVMSFKLSLGKIAILKEDMYSNEAIASFPIKDTMQLLPEYLYYALKTVNLYKFADKAAKGVTLNKKKLNLIEIPFTDIQGQRKIVDILKIAEKLVENRDSQISALDELTRSIFLEMFGDPVVNPNEILKKRLGDTGELKRGMSKHRPRNAPELLGGPYPLIQTGDISRTGLFIENYKSTYSELGLKQSKMWKAGTLCITIAANIAETSILKFDSCFPDSVVGYKPFENMNTIFVHYWFSFFQKILENSAPESAQKNINLKILNDIEIITPSIELQNEFANKVMEIYEWKLKLEAGKNLMEELYNSLLHQAFKGQLFQGR